MAQKSSTDPAVEKIEGGPGDILQKIDNYIGKYAELTIYRLLFKIPWYFYYATFGYGLGNLVWRIAKDMAKNDVNSIRVIHPDWSYRKAQRLSKASFVLLGYGFFYLHLIQMPNWYPNNMHKYCEVRGRSHLDASLKKGKGVIIAAPHLGLLSSVDVGLAVMGYNVNAIVNMEVAKYINIVRNMPNIHFIGSKSFSQNPKLKQTLINILKRNEILVIFCDFASRKQMGVQFLGHLCHTPTSVAGLAQETGAAVIPAYAYPLTLTKHRLVFHPEMEMIPQSTKKEYLGYNMFRINQFLSRFIKKGLKSYISERITFSFERRYQKKFTTKNLDELQLMTQALQFTEDLVNNTYEIGRNDENYLQIVKNMKNSLNKISLNQVAHNSRYNFVYKVDHSVVRDSIIRFLMYLKDLKLDPPLLDIIHDGIAEIVKMPKCDQNEGQ